LDLDLFDDEFDASVLPAFDSDAFEGFPELADFPIFVLRSFDDRTDTRPAGVAPTGVCLIEGIKSKSPFKDTATPICRSNPLDQGRSGFFLLHVTS